MTDLEEEHPSDHGEMKDLLEERIDIILELKEEALRLSPSNHRSKKLDLRKSKEDSR